MDPIETPPETSETPPGTPAETSRDSFALSVCELRKKQLSIREIAKQLGCSPAKVNRSMNQMVERFSNEMGLGHLSRDEIKSRIYGFAPKAANQIQKLALGSKKDEVKLKASADMLDRAGFNPVQKHQQICENCEYWRIQQMSREELVSEIHVMLERARSRMKEKSALGTS